MNHLSELNQLKIKLLVEQCMQELDQKQAPKPKTFFEKVVDIYSRFCVACR